MNATNERTSMINIDESDMSSINTNADTSATNKIVTNTIHTNATNTRTNTINIDKSDVSMTNTNTDMSVTNTNIIIASNEKNDDKEKEKEEVVTINSNSNSNSNVNEIRFDDFCESKNTRLAVG
jgi:asparagine N-glycosylation enzyme membrane subunit Stt3